MPNTNEFEDSSQQSRDKLLDPSPGKQASESWSFYKKNAYPSFSDPHCYGHEKETGLDCYNYSFKNEKSSRNGLNKDNLDVFGFEKGKLPKGSAYIKYQSYICNKSRSYIQNHQPNQNYAVNEDGAVKTVP